MVKKSDQTAIREARKFGRAHDPDTEHADQVTRTSLALFDALRELHGLGTRERVLLEATALMHDVGYETRPEQHQKGSRDLILDSKLSGFSPRELMVMACIARYHGSKEPDPDHKVYRDLSEGDQRVVNWLAAILRIADGLDRSHSGSAGSVSVERKGDLVRVLVHQRVPAPDDIAGAVRKAGLFEHVFGTRIEIVQS